jgi:predicted methyltransferase
MRETGTRYTFRANRLAGRHGWLRLTPAYSVGLVRELIAELDAGRRVLDPFCGTGTTALACAEAGIGCDTIDINPFLVWLARAKCADYGPSEIEEERALLAQAARAEPDAGDWRPPISRIDRWWDEPALAQLAAAWRVITQSGVGLRARDLATVAFCRVLLAVSKASYSHQSVSFSSDISRCNLSVQPAFEEAAEAIAVGASQLLRSDVKVVQGDARDVRAWIDERSIDAVITSPPYPNRMSYVRELRPYMFWLGCLADGRAAGDLDWAAIGGTWGIATSRLASWTGVGLGRELIGAAVVDSIAERNPLLASYVLKYAEDMADHFDNLRAVMRPGGRATYIIGNSHFFGVPVETQDLFAVLLRRAGFRSPEIRLLRRRTSKTGLFEYAVSAVVPA